MVLPYLVGAGTSLVAKKVLSSLGKKYALKAGKKILKNGETTILIKKNLINI